MPPASAIGSLAARLRAARGTMIGVELEAEDFLATLFPEWRSRFPPHRSWIFVPDDGIEVWDVSGDITGAVGRLFAAGFGEVRLHPHSAGRFLSCNCKFRHAKEET